LTRAYETNHTGSVVGVGSPSNGFRVCSVVAVIALFVLAPVIATAGENPSGLDVILIVEVRDTAGWIALHDEVLRTADPTSKPLAVSVARNNPRRAITVREPRFTVSIMKGLRSFTVTVTGKVTGGEADRGLTAFEHAVVENQGGTESDLELSYGLSTVPAQVIEMHLTRP
jgi:hypothetical protein